MAFLINPFIQIILSCHKKTTDIAFLRIIVPTIRRAYSSMSVMDLVGVQPMIPQPQTIIDGYLDYIDNIENTQ